MMEMNCFLNEIFNVCIEKMFVKILAKTIFHKLNNVYVGNDNNDVCNILFNDVDEKMLGKVFFIHF